MIRCCSVIVKPAVEGTGGWSKPPTGPVEVTTVYELLTREQLQGLHAGARRRRDRGVHADNIRAVARHLRQCRSPA